MKPHVQNLRIADVAKFSSDMVKNLFMYITDIDTQVQDKYAKSILSSYGCEAAVVKRLMITSMIGSVQFSVSLHARFMYQKMKRERLCTDVR